MSFFSFAFVVFAVVAFVLYWGVCQHSVKAQNILLLLASYIFYGMFNYKGLLLLLFSSLVTFVCCKVLTGRNLCNGGGYRCKQYVTIIGIAINLLILAFFKYCNFFIDVFVDFCGLFGYIPSVSSLNILLPVGVSFYTFSAISYLVDCYTGKIRKAGNLVESLLYLSFFPAILSGPIHKATEQLPQWQKKREFDYSTITYGLKIILWGVFMKLCVADRLGTYVDTVYADINSFSGTTLLLSSLLYSCQIYLDFAGYSLIALGCGNLFGIRLQVNFNRPYLSRTITEFWSRWHISLTSFFRNYLYIPLGGNRVPKSKWILNIMIVFLISGLWHGASYAFIVWGLFHGIAQVIEKLAYGERMKQIKHIISFGNIIRMILTFGLVSLFWIFFRMENISDAFTVIKRIITEPSISDIFWGYEGRLQFLFSILLLMVVFCKDIFEEYSMKAVAFWNRHRTCRWIAYYVLCILIVALGMNSSENFIYYQF